MAAETLLSGGCAVTVHERMPTFARRLLMAGIGGLNLTHSEPLPRFLGRYAGSVDVEGAVRAMPPEAVAAWCESLGEPVFTGSSGRVFPRRMKASGLLRRWLSDLTAAGAALHARHDWTGWEGESLCFATPDGPLLTRPDATILALGGATWPKLGSDGSWVTPLAADGTQIAPLQPSNCGCLIDWSERFRDRWAGTPLKAIEVRCGEARSRGEAVVTRDGLEGGAIYAIGGALRGAMSGGSDATLSIDLKPDLTEAQLAQRLAKARRGDSLANRLRKLRLAPVAAGLLRQAGEPPADPRALALSIKSLQVPVHGLQGMARAISTAGGVGADALDGLMLRRRPGTFVAGEMLDWDAPTGGYLLTASLASGRAAARQALDWLQ